MDFRFKPENAPIDEAERLIAIEVPVQIGPTDVRTVDASSGPWLDLTQLRVKKQTGPSSPANLDLKAPVEVPVICEVMEDGSLICAVKPDTTVSAVNEHRGGERARLLHRHPAITQRGQVGPLDDRAVLPGENADDR